MANKFVGIKLEPVEQSYDLRDIVIHHLGVGAEAIDLNYLYENADVFDILPSFAFKLPDLIELAQQKEFKGVGVASGLHAEHELELLEPIPETCDKLVTNAEVVEVADKGKGMLIRCQMTTATGGKTLYRNKCSMYIPGAGGFGGERGENTKFPEIPAITPHFTGKQSIPAIQSAIFRLSGDYNPIHIDPEKAKEAGLEAPIMHGLCVLAHSVRILLSNSRSLAKAHDPRPSMPKMTKLKARFLSPVPAADVELTTQVWLLGPEEMVLRGSVAGTPVVLAHIFFQRATQFAPPRARL